MALRQDGRTGGSRWLLAVTTLACAGLGADVGVPAQSSRTGTGEVVAIRQLKLKPDIDPRQFEQFVTGTYNPAWEAAVPGMKGYIARGDRGVQKDGYALILIFDSEKTRNAIFPKAGAGVSDRFAPLLQVPLGLNEKLDAYLEAGSLSAYTDYVALR